MLPRRAVPRDSSAAAPVERASENVRAVQFRAFVDAFERLGYDVQSLLSKLGVERADFDGPDDMVPIGVTGEEWRAESIHWRPRSSCSAVPRLHHCVTGGG